MINLQRQNRKEKTQQTTPQKTNQNEYSKSKYATTLMEVQVKYTVWWNIEICQLRQ